MVRNALNSAFDKQNEQSIGRGDSQEGAAPAHPLVRHTRSAKNERVARSKNL